MLWLRLKSSQNGTNQRPRCANFGRSAPFPSRPGSGHRSCSLGPRPLSLHNGPAGVPRLVVASGALQMATMEELPTSSPEQLDFASRIGKAAAPLVKIGMDLRDAERAAARMAAATMLEEGAHPAVVEQPLA